MMAPDWHLQLFAFGSLALAAAGEVTRARRPAVSRPCEGVLVLCDQATIPYLFGRVIDAIAISKDVSEFERTMSTLVLTAVGTGVFTGCRGSTFIYLGARFGARLRGALFDSLLEQELDFFAAVKSGEISSRLTADCQKIAGCAAGRSYSGPAAPSRAHASAVFAPCLPARTGHRHPSRCGCSHLRAPSRRAHMRFSRAHGHVD